MSSNTNIQSDYGVVSCSTVVSGSMIPTTDISSTRDTTLSGAALAWAQGHDITGGLRSLTEPMDPYTASLWFHKCVSKIQQAVKGVPLVFSRKAARSGGRFGSYNNIRCFGAKSARADGDIIETGEVVDLFTQPNALQSWPQFIEDLIGHYYCSGSAAIVKGGDTVGRKAKSLYVIDGRHIQPVIETDSLGLPMLMGYEYTTPKTHKKIRFIPDDVVYMYRWQPNARHKFTGLKPAVPGRLAIATDYSAAMFNAHALNNNGEPSLVVTAPGVLTAEQRAEFRAKWAAKFSGPKNARNMLLLEGGSTATPFTSSFKDLEFQAGKTTTRLEICALMDVPPVVAGFIDAAGDSSAYSTNAWRMFWEGLIFSLLDDVVPGLQRIVDGSDQTLECWFDVEDQPIVMTMRLSRIETVIPLHGRGVPMADLNAKFDLGLPDRPWYQKGYLPIGVIAADSLANEAEPDTDEGPQEDSYAALANALTDTRNTPDTPTTREALPSEAMRQRLWQAAMRGLTPSVTKLKGQLRARYTSHQRKMLAAVKRILSARNTPATRDAAAETKQIIKVLLDLQISEAAEFKAAIAKISELTVEVAATQVASAASGDAAVINKVVDSVTDSPVVKKLINNHAYKSSTLISGMEKTIVEESIAEGLHAGESTNQIADRIETVYKKSRAQAVSIARNTQGQIYSQARKQTLAAAGFDRKAWLHSRGGGKRRESHIEAEQRYLASPIPLVAKFVIGRANLDHPRDWSAGHPEETVNCHCVHVGRFSSEKAADWISREMAAIDTAATIIETRLTNRSMKK